MSAARVVAMAGGVILLILMIAVTLVNGAGFSGKTLFDWLGVLIFPIVISAGGFWLEQVQRRRDHQIQARREEEAKQEALVQTYLEQMRDLLVSQELASSPSGSEIRRWARAATLNVLEQVSSFRKGDVVRFLYASGLINAHDPIIDLAQADLSQTFLQATLLRDAALSGTTLDHAVLRQSDLSGGNLSNADLRGANLAEANLTNADLKTASLVDANLSNAALVGADFSTAGLRGANLQGANLQVTYGLTQDQIDQRSQTKVPDFRKVLSYLPHGAPTPINIWMRLSIYDTTVHKLFGFQEFRL